MQQYTSEEALNGILNIIQTTVNEYNQSKQNKASGQTSSLIEELLAGVGASASKGVNLGDQVKTLADGMSMLKSQGITQDDATNVAFMIGAIGKAVSGLEFNPSSTDAVLAIALSLAILGKIDSAVIDNIAYIAAHLDASSAKNIYDFIMKLDAAEAENIATVINAFNEFSKIDTHTLDNITTIAESINYDVGANISLFFAEFDVDEKTLQSVNIVAQALTALGGINEDVIKNINKLGQIDTNVAAQLNNFIKSLDFTNAEALQDENVKLSITILSTFINEVLNILNKTNLGFETLFLPIKGRLVGKAIAAFFNELIKVIPKDEIKLEIDGLGQLIQSFYPLIEKDGKYSIGKLLSAMSAKNGQAIGMFFAAIVEPIPDDKKIKDTITSISALLQLVSSFGLKDYMKIRKLLTKENGEKISQFFEAIILPLNQTEYPDFKPITDFLKALSNLGLLGVITLTLLKPILTPAFGESISGFITKLVDGLDEDKMERLKGFSTAMKNISMGILMMTGSIVLLAGAIELFGAMTVIGATVIATVFVGAVILMLNLLKKDSNNIKEGTSALKDVTTALLLMTADIYLLTGAAILLSYIDWEEIGKVAVMMAIVGAFVTWSMYISDKWQKGGENAQKAMIGVGALLITSAAAIAIAVWVAKENSLADLTLGIGMLALIVVGAYFMVTKLLEVANKDYDAALKNVFALVGILAATALVARFLLAPLTEHAAEVITGAVIVLAIVAVMVGLTKWLAKIEPDNLSQASKALVVIGGVIVAITLIALFGFVPISEKMGDVLLGGAVVLGVIVIMSLIVWGLSKIDTDSLKTAKDTIIAEAVILGVVSLVCFLLIPIGKNSGDVLLGFGTVAVIIAAMIGATYLLTMVDEKDLTAAKNTLYAIGFIVAAISLISLLLFIPIGANAGKVLPGAAIVIGIVAIMAGIVWILSRCKEDNLKMATITMAVITAMILAISVIALTLFIPISDQYDAVLVGAVIVLGIIAIMGLMVLGLSQIKPDNLKTAMLSMAVMAFVLLGVSLIAKEILIPIGYEAEAALYGGGIILGIVGIMAAIVWGLSKIDKKDLLAGSLSALGIALILALNAYVIQEFIVPIGEYAEAAALGGAVILGTVAVMSLIVWGLSKIPKERLALGGVAVAGIGLLLWELAKTMDPYIDLCKKMYENGGEVALGGLELVATLTAWGAILWAVGALSEVLWVIALGALIIEPIALLLWQLGETMPSYIDMCIYLHRNIEEATLGGLELAATLTAWSLIFTLIGTVGAIGVIASPFIAVMVGVIYGISKVMRSYIQTAKTAYANKDALTNGTKLIGDAIEGIGQLMTKVGVLFGNPLSMIAMTMGLAGLAEISAGILSLSLVIKSFAYISQTLLKNNIDLKRVQEVADIFTADKGLVWAIEDIIERMTDVGVWASAKAAAIAQFLQPVFSCLGDFIKIIVDALNMKYVDEWDEHGKPKTYMKVTPEMYAQAGILISAAFGYFLKELGKGMEALKDVSANTLLVMGYAIRPIIGAVSQFTDSVLSVLSAAIPYEWDENGKPTKFRKFNPDDFTAAAVVISLGFGTFIRELGPAMQALGKESARVIAIMGQGIQPLMEAVAKFTDMIFSFQNGKEMSYTDEKGNRVTKLMKIDPDKFEENGELIADAFVSFVTAIYDEFSKENYTVTHWYGDEEAGSKLVQVLKSLENIGSLINSVNSFMDMVAKSVEKSKEYNIKDKGVIIANALITFTTTLVNQFVDSQEDVENTAKTMKEVISLVKKTDSAYTALVKLLRERDVEVTKEDIINVYRMLVAAVKPESVDISVLKTANVKDISGLVPYLKKIKDAANLMKNIAKLSEVKEELLGAVTLFITEIDELKKIEKPDIRNVASLPGYLKYIKKTANLMVELSEIMNSADITAAITKFLKDIDLLTQKDLQKKTAASQKALISFQIDLKNFTAQVVTSQKKVIKFTTSMKKATDALRKFDDAIVNRERERNEALQKFGDLVKNIADNMNSLNTEINNLDQNKIMSNFRGIGDLFNMVLGRSNDNDRQNNQNQNNNQQNNQNQRQQNQTTQRGQQNQTTQQIVNTRPQGRQVINVYFADTTLSGFVESIE